MQKINHELCTIVLIRMFHVLKWKQQKFIDLSIVYYQKSTHSKDTLSNNSRNISNVLNKTETEVCLLRILETLTMVSMLYWILCVYSCIFEMMKSTMKISNVCHCESLLAYFYFPPTELSFILHQTLAIQVS